MKIAIFLCVVALAFADAGREEEKKTCLEEPDEGMCRGYFESYFYNKKTRDCEIFVYGGCGGNGNRYATKDECLESCSDTIVWESDAVCELPKEEGPCYASFKRYYFDKVLGECKEFEYGGCGGNGNNFETLEWCKIACTIDKCGANQVFTKCGTACPLTCDNFQNPPKICPQVCIIGCACAKGYVKTRDGKCVRPEECPAAARPQQKSCLDKPETGLCKAYFPSWYYDVQTESCKRFIYGGCGGNGNRYRTEEDCLKQCGDVLNEAPAGLCELPAESGPCRALIPKYYFDKTTGECKKFVYGGCQGNANRFNTKDECEAICGQRI